MEPGEITELRPLGSPPQEDGEEEQRVTWFQKACDKLANVDSKKVLLVAIICIGNFVIFCSIDTFDWCILPYRARGKIIKKN